MEWEKEVREFYAEYNPNKRASLLERFSNKGKAIILSGLVLIGSMAFIKNAKATVQASNDPEVKLSDLSNEGMLDVVFVNDSVTELTDIRNDDQVRLRAQEVLSAIKSFGLEDFTEQEVFTMIKLYGGQNPFDRQVEIEDVVFMMNRLYVIMNQEMLNSARTIRGFAEEDPNQRVFDYTSFAVDGHHGEGIIAQLQQYRHGMIMNPSKEGAYPYANEFVKYLYHVYLTNGFGTYPSYYEAETSGERLLGVQLALNTAELGASIGSQVSYQTEQMVDGEITYCDWDIKKVVEKMNEAVCEDIATGQMLNPMTETMFGTIHEANSNDKVKVLGN